MLSMRAVETKASIEAGTVGCHQIDLLRGSHFRALQQLGHDAVAQSLPLMRRSHDHIPEHSPEGAITAGPTKADESMPAPGRDGHITETKHAVQGGKTAPPCPETVLIKQALELLECSDRTPAKTEPES
jgi:hypothetical protein